MAVTNLHYLPLTIFVLLPGTVLITYVIAVCLKHVEIDFPYISDTGAQSPESNIFGQLLNIVVFIVTLTMYVRYKQIEQYYRDHLSSESLRIQRLNTISLRIGFLAVFGMSLVANFQETSVLEVHLLGAGFLFGFGIVYLWFQTVMSFYMHPLLNSRRMAIFRAVLTVLSTITFLMTVIFAAISLQKFDGKDKRKWYPRDGGFTTHVVSAACEWITTMAFDVYILTFAKEFRLISLQSPKVLFLTSEGLGLPTSDIYQSEDQAEITQSQRMNSDHSNSSSLGHSGQTVSAQVH